MSSALLYELYYGGMTGGPAQPRLELHSVDLDTWDDGYWGDPMFLESHPYDLDEPWPYRFWSGQSVWVRASDGEWYPGRVVGQAKKGRTRSEEALFWCVEFTIRNSRVRKWVAPLNGDVKPDNEHTNKLLLEASWLKHDSD